MMFSWCASIAAVLVAFAMVAAPHAHRETFYPGAILVGLFYVTVFATFASAVVAVVRGLRCGAARTVFCAAIPLLLSGTYITLAIIVVLSGEK